MADINPGDRVRVRRHPTSQQTARVMAVAEGYAMVRYPRAAPFIEPIKELARVLNEGEVAQ